jgi:hypothetical protein
MISIKGNTAWYELYGIITDLKSYFGLATSFLAVQMVFLVLCIFLLT